MLPIVPTWLLLVGAVAGVLAGCTADASDCAATATCPPPEVADASTSSTRDGNVEQDAADDIDSKDEQDSGPSAASGLALGASCSAADECESGYCVDGTCCDSECSGVCERCDLPDSSGTCAPVPDGADPDGDCTDGSGSACDGVCNGERACRFPAYGTPCGATSCQNGVQHDAICDGEGRCVENQVSCGDYACGAEACRSSCTSSSHCAASAYCDDNECRPRKDNGAACSGDEECQSGICSDGVCCATACEAPWSCSTGECLCNGIVCPAKESCTVFFIDGDGDGYPASSAYDVVGCSGTPPPDILGRKFYDSAEALLDCDDSDPNVHPKQTKFFTEARSNGTFDYDCDGVETKRYGAGADFRVCKSCPNPGGICSVGLAPSSDSCDVVSGAFQGILPPACGEEGTLVRCEVVPVCQVGGRLTERTVQGCR